MDKLSDGRHKYANSDWWILSAQDKHTPAIALDALITRFFGQAHSQAELVREGTAYYTQALSSLRQDLQGPEAFSFGTLAATSTLSMFELVTFTSHFGWVQHAGGLARLIQARGPGRHKHGQERKIFLENRLLLVSRAMVMREKTFLAEPAWKTVPWEDSPNTKDVFDYLMDIVCDVPSILADADRLLLSLGSSEALPEEDLFLEVAKRTACAMNELDNWWRGWAATHLGRCWERPPDATTRISYDQEGPVFDTVLFFETYWTCYVTIFHNALRIVLLGIWHELSNLPYASKHPIGTPNNEINPLPLLGISTDIRGLALEIFRSIEFSEYQARKFLGTYCILFPILYAQQCLSPQSREGRWLLSLTDRNFKSLKTFKADARLAEGLPSCGRGQFGQKVVSNSSGFPARNGISSTVAG